MIYIGHVPRRKSVAIGIPENGRIRVLAYCRSEADAEILISTILADQQAARETAVKRCVREAEIGLGTTALARALARARRLRSSMPIPTSSRARAD